MHPIYYVFARDTGAFMGSGTVFFDDETYGSTEAPCIHDPEAEPAPHWDGSSWVAA